jgi:hypothetical protein
MRYLVVVVGAVMMWIGVFESRADPGRKGHGKKNESGGSREKLVHNAVFMHKLYPGKARPGEYRNDPQVTPIVFNR